MNKPVVALDEVLRLLDSVGATFQNVARLVHAADFGEATTSIEDFIPIQTDGAKKRTRRTKAEIEAYGIIYLEHEYIEVEGIKIFGSPYTPTFGNWSFMKSRATINRLWETVTEPADILILHGPPKGILDLSYDRDGILERCGDNTLHKLIKGMKPKLVCFGHIHDNQDILNFGTFTRNGVTYSNAAAVKDGEMDKGIKHHGNLFNL